MVSKVRKIVLLLGLCLPLSGLANPAETLPESVVVVANKAVPDSLRVAQAYMERRSIPQNNLIVIEAPQSETIQRQQFLDTVRNPILQAFLDQKLVNAFEGPTDAFGRKTLTILENPIRYMVLCYGVPLRINSVPVESIDDYQLRETLLKRSQPQLLDGFSSGPLARNQASVDGELALLLIKDMPLNGFVPNPFFRQRNPELVRDVIKVTRLDGPSPEAVIRMMDSALQAEKEGLKGRAYVDEDGRSGNYQIGNQWLAQTAEIFTALGFDVQHDTDKKTIPEDARFDAPVLYAGWYSGLITGPFTLPGFRFPTGAVAAHLHSYSAGTLRSTSKQWVGPLVERGVAATFGNVAEPYLTFTHNFDQFFAALGQGWNFADAAYYALPVLSWQGIAVGDPLYRPFKVTLEEQLESVDDPLAILENQYVLLRKARLVASQQGEGAYLKEIEKAMRVAPGLALAIEKARLLENAGKRRAAAESLSYFANLKPTSSAEWGLYAEMADLLDRLGQSKEALKIYRSLEKVKMPEEVQLAFLKRGIKIAQNAGEKRLASEWQTRVTPPPPPPEEPPAGDAPPASQKPGS